ncbi:MAG TPA: hypothetical protein VLX28_07305 [Thermoanaerobaculia bacterium]|nr:hypothetical protein [Thermoanaerobaculia bacterium]
MSRRTPESRPPEPGGLYVLAETAGFPVEWAVLDAPAGNAGQFLAVPADTNPLAGSADVEILANEPAGPLSLRCRFALWLDAARFDPDRRTGALAPDAVARALEKKAALEAGDPAASPLAWETDADPEYEDWVREVLHPAHAALASPAAREAPAGRTRPFRRGSTLGNPYALAASVLLMVTLGLAGGLLWQTGKITDLDAVRHRTEEELRRERERHAGELRQTEEANRREIAERERLAAQREQEDRNRIADLEQRLDRAGHTRPLVNAPYVWLSPKDPVRGEPDKYTLPPGAGYLFLLFTVNDLRPFPEYRLEIVNKDAGRSVWSSRGLHKTTNLELSVALPRDLLPSGDYRFRLFGLKDGKAEPAGEYEMRIVEK